MATRSGTFVNPLNSTKFFQGLFPDPKVNDQIIPEKHYLGQEYKGTSFTMYGDFIGKPQVSNLDIDRLGGIKSCAEERLVGDRIIDWLELVVDEEKGIGIKTLGELLSITHKLSDLALLIDHSLCVNMFGYEPGYNGLDYDFKFAFNIRTDIEVFTSEYRSARSKQTLNIEFQLGDQTYMLRLDPGYRSLSEICKDSEVIKMQIERFQDKLSEYIDHHFKIAQQRDQQAFRDLDDFK
jgi:hypothetical protein